MRPALRAYISGMAALAVLSLLTALVVAPPALTPHQALLAFLLTGMTALTYRAPLRLTSKQGVILDTALHTVMLLVLPVSAAALCSAIAAAAGNCSLRRRWFNVLFNTAQVTLSVLAAAGLYHLLAPVSLASADRNFTSLLAVFPAAAMLYMVSMFAVDVAVALQHRRLPFAQWRTVHRTSVVPHLALVAAGAVLAPAVGRVPWLALIAAAPVIAVRAALRAAMQADEAVVCEAINLAERVEACVPSRAGHARRMADLVAQVGEGCGLDEEACRRVTLAARLHDLGLVLRPGDPTGLEIETGHEQALRWHDHAEAAAEFTGGQLGLRGVAEVLRFHHMSYDGQDSPQGMAGIDLPLESCLLAVCEAWVTLTSPCDYRPALRPDQALVILRAGAGTQWHPAVVAALADQVTDGELLPTALPAPTALYPRALSLAAS
jgi:hypothetical protein